VAVRARLRIAEYRDEALFDSAGNRVFEHARFIVDLRRRHAQDVGEETLRLAMTAHDAYRYFQLFVCQLRTV